MGAWDKAAVDAMCADGLHDLDKHKASHTPELPAVNAEHTLQAFRRCCQEVQDRTYDEVRLDSEAAY
jgi:hypothetical protein